jgi:cellulose synthase/poly-beta-1,6-N-acetylglucosamine synthase-like glycosyltransferase
MNTSFDGWLAWTSLTAFIVATLLLAAYGLHLYALVGLFRRKQKNTRAKQAEIIGQFHSKTPPDQWPTVTTQIPLYNESIVAARVIEAVAAIDYPIDKHEIQILDDSTDDTRKIVDRTADRLSVKGYMVTVLRRTDRDGYKAGALARGVTVAKGEFIGIFDADFVPPVDFYHKSIPLLKADERLACLQGRWAHLNENESWLTRAQSLGIDGHFAIEQGARAWNNLMMNFNGTAGVWRKSAIEDPNVGGWSGDTLTEDLDLSYRAQLAGWKLNYCLDLACPAELPGTVNALKSQQRRWATGSIQVACKLLPRIWRAPLSFAEKIEATLHLTHYSVAIWMLILAVAARPMLFVWLDGRYMASWFWIMWIIVLCSAVAPSLTYAFARHTLGGGWSGIRIIPYMLVLGVGLCLNNAVAVIRGLFLHGGEFVRTPKSGSTGQSASAGAYKPIQTHLWMGELTLGIYSILCFVLYVISARWAFSVFLLIYGIGFLLTGYLSRPREQSTTPTSELIDATVPAGRTTAG